MTDFKVILTTVIPEVTEVRFYQETVEHVRAEHPEVALELPSVAAATEAALVNPTHVEQSYNRSFVFVGAGSTNASGDPLRIPVRVVEGTSARVKTVYFATTQTGDNVIWRRNDE